MRLQILLALVIATTVLPPVAAAPGDIDSSFGIGGRGLMPLGTISYDQARGAALQSDGKIVVVGDSFLAGGYSTEPTNLVVVRLNPDGSRDFSFGTGGIAVRRLSLRVTGSSVIVQSDGKIVIGGFADIETSVSQINRAFLLVRLLPNGASDNSFGTSGVVISNLNPDSGSALTSLALQPDGKVVAAGLSNTSATSPPLPRAVAVARYNSNGSLDNSFDTDGKTFIYVDGASSRANTVAIQSDGKIVVGGSVDPSNFFVLRLNANGSPDNSFDGDGSAVTTIAGTTSAVSDVVLLPDGKIIAAGTAGSGSSRNIAVARYNDNGSLDNTFDNDGVVVTDIGNDDIAAAARIQPDGKLLVGGYSNIVAFQGFEFFALRYNTNGTLDNTFDTDGKVTTRVGVMGTNRTSEVLLQPDGRIVLAGSVVDTFSGDFALVRYNTDGSLDGGFDGDGKALLELGMAGDSVYATAVQPDGKIVCVGYVFDGWTSQAGVSRFNADGTPDVTFGVKGSVIYAQQKESAYGVFANDVAIQSDGKIVFSIASSGSFPYTVVRLNTDGSYDETFGNGGTVTFPVGTALDEAAGLELQTDGKIVLAGVSHNADLTSGPSIVRLKNDGTPDATFGAGGKVLTTDPAISGLVDALALSPDGKIILAGGGFVANDYTYFTTRYNTNGTIDASFGGTGAVYTSIGGYDNATMIAVQPDGKIIVGGITHPGASAVRYNPNGTLDNSFDRDGKLVVPGELSLYTAFGDVAIQPNGKINFVGSERIPVGTFGIERFNAAVFRFNPDGSPDTSFGVNGRVINAIGDHNSSHSSISLLANGKIVAGGTSSNGLNDDFTVFRYLGDGTRAPFDFDGDGKTDIGIFRPSVGEWWINRSGNGSTIAFQFGASTDHIVPADYTGDGKTDVAIWRPSNGEWFILRSEDNSFYSAPFGINSDVPAPADYDGDGKADIGIFRPSSATWYIQRTGDHGTTIQQFGANGDQPVAADYDGDGKTDIAIFRPSNGQWWLDRSTAGGIAFAFGNAADKRVQGDYTGDGKADVALWRPSSGEWYVIRSEDFSFFSAPFGTAGDVPSPGDYDGDGKFDVTVFRPSSATWYSQRTTAGTLISQFGITGDRPVASAFVE